ncbi:MAG TPA: hypothetical protein VFC85_07655 [Verrucomicrobiae bacterium]|nr:hypothetical protein [Verrucomicrobiae bacterium]
MKYITIFSILLAFALCGCSVSTRPSAKFSRQISSADRLLVTNHYYAFGATVTGTNVSNLITAIKLARTKRWGTDLDWGDPFVCNLVFYAGTNQLASIPTVYGVFNLDGVEYSDVSGVLNAFCKNVAGDRTR